jgi:hypothetical protein
MMRSFGLKPVSLSSATLARMAEAQHIFHKLYAGAARDVDFIHKTFDPMSTKCAWTRREIAVYDRVASHASTKPLLLLPNSGYMQSSGPGAAPTGSCSNVQAGEPYQLQLVHSLQSAEHEGVQAGPLRAACSAVATAARLVHPSRTCVALLAKPIDRLALRTRVDLRGVGTTLKRDHNVHTVLYVSMADLARTRLDSSGDLVLDEHRISVIYSRYDFSHPWGKWADPLPPNGGSAPTDELLAEYAHLRSGLVGQKRKAAQGIRVAQASSRLSQSVAEGLADWMARARCMHATDVLLLRQCRGRTPIVTGRPIACRWPAIERMELSNAIISSSLGCRLAHRRKAQHAYVRGGGLDRFLARSEADILRTMLPQQWSLDPAQGDGSEEWEAQALISADPVAFVAKNVLRPRTGSSVTQDRLASGGQIVIEPSDLIELARSDARAWYLLFRKVTPLLHGANIVHNGKVQKLSETEATSEVAAFGCYLDDGAGNAITDQVAGFGARTRPARSTHPLAAELGYGALNAVRSGV